MPSEGFYEGREQTAVKHSILSHYLKRFALIVGSTWETITYVDGFAGPWNVRSPELSDSSFAIALDELRKARTTHSKNGRDLGLRCFFLEENRDAYLQLQAFANQVDDAQIEVKNGSFEESVEAIQKFIRKGQRTFHFIFIDPTGWTGFACRLISPLLRMKQGEVLINFMTSHIRRFLNDENSRESFENLFGSAEVMDRVAGLTGQDRDDALISEYSDMLKREGGFTHVLPAIVLHPEDNKTHFHLIYATRHPKGVEVFKGAEKSAMQEMERLRSEAQQRKREERTGQWELFQPADTSTEGRHYNQLRDRYLSRPKQRVLNLLKGRKRLLYDEAWELALESPLVWESDLKDWVKDWQSKEELRIEGLTGRQRVPSREKSHFLVWQSRRP